MQYQDGILACNRNPYTIAAKNVIPITHPATYYSHGCKNILWMYSTILECNINPCTMGTKNVIPFYPLVTLTNELSK